jgi:hypothetical protein
MPNGVRRWPSSGGATWIDPEQFRLFPVPVAARAGREMAPTGAGAGNEMEWPSYLRMMRISCFVPPLLPNSDAGP